MKLKIDAGDFEYLTGATQYVLELYKDEEKRDAVNVFLRLYASHHCEVWAANDENKVCLAQGSSVDFRGDLVGFSHIQVRAPKSADIAVSLVRVVRGEKLDLTPVAVSVKTNKKQTLSDVIRRELRNLMFVHGEDPSIVDEFDLGPLDGDFDFDDPDEDGFGDGFAEDDEPVVDDDQDDQDNPEVENPPEEEGEPPDPDNAST